MAQMIEVKTAELSGAALQHAWKAAFPSDKHLSNCNAANLLDFARFVIGEHVGPVVSIPAELLP